MDQEGRGHRVGIHNAGQAHPARRQLLDDADVGQQIEPEPTVGLRNRDPEEAELAHPFDDLGGELVLALEQGGVRQNLTGDEAPNVVNDLLPQLRISLSGVHVGHGGNITRGSC